jgi:putative ABC transport system substrate-binding protein
MMQMTGPKSLKSAVGLLFFGFAMILTRTSAVRAQPAQARIGVLTPGLTLANVLEGLHEGLAGLGYVNEKKVTFIVEDTKGDPSDSAELAERAAKLVSAKPNVLFAVSTPHVQAAKHATSTVPIVFGWVGDPIQAGLMASYPFSKNNLTGVTANGDSLSGKRLEVLLEIAPKAKRLLVLVSPKEIVSVRSFQALDEAARKFGVKLIRRDVTDREEIKKTLEEMPRHSFDATFHVPSNLVRTHIDLLVKKSKADRIPLAVHEEPLVERGALFSYGLNPRLVGQQAAGLVHKVLKGSKPGEIMIESPERILLTVNTATAKEIGLKIPLRIIDRADRLVD